MGFDLEARILGFATISAAHLEVGALTDALRRKPPAYPLPVLRLARLAVAEEAQALGIGRELLRAVFTLAWRMADEFGCVGVVVDAKPDAVGFYERLGFTTLGHGKGALGDRPEATAHVPGARGDSTSSGARALNTTNLGYSRLRCRNSAQRAPVACAPQWVWYENSGCGNSVGRRWRGSDTGGGAP